MINWNYKKLFKVCQNLTLRRYCLLLALIIVFQGDLKSIYRFIHLVGVPVSLASILFDRIADQF